MKNRSVDDKANNKLESVTAAGRALLLAGLVGMTVGAMTGMALGVFVFIIGAFFGAIYGIPIGFAAAIVGVAIGGRRGCAIGGVLCGILGGMIFGTLFGDTGQGSSHSFLQSAVSGFGPLAMIVLGGSGLIAGSYVDRRLSSGAKAAGIFCDLQVALKASRIYEIPLSGRLALAVCELAPFALFLSSVIRLLKP